MSENASALPPLQNRWLTVLTGIRDPAPEPKATCSNCVMCAGKKTSGSQIVFSPSVKCCTYVPNVPNFLAGRALKSSGRESIRARIATRSGITPLGLGLAHADIDRVVGAQANFGRSADVVCPHFQVETQGCEIWESRNAVCSTWFCKHERGEVSQRFWHAVRDLLMAAEERLAYWCLTEGDLPGAQVSAVLEHRASIRTTVQRAMPRPGNPTPSTPGSPITATDGRPAAAEDDESSWYARMWGDWLGREEEWFERCAVTLDPLRPEDLIRLMDGVRNLADDVTDAWADLQREELPDRLAFAPRQGSEIDGDLVRLVGYSAFDPLTAPLAILGSLRLFDGRLTSHVLEEVARTPGLSLADDLLGRLHDFGIIAPVTAPVAVGPGSDR